MLAERGALTGPITDAGTKALLAARDEQSQRAADAELPDPRA